MILEHWIPLGPWQSRGWHLLGTEPQIPTSEPLRETETLGLQDTRGMQHLLDWWSLRAPGSLANISCFSFFPFGHLTSHGWGQKPLRPL